MLSIRRALSTLAVMSVGLACTVGSGSSTTTAQGNCDPNYGLTADGACVPGDRDYDCPELWAQGIGDIPVVGTDWMRLDGYQDFETGEWISPPDGLGCEWTDAGAGVTRPSLPNESEPTRSSLTDTVIDPDAASSPLRAIGIACLADGDFACAQENLEAAYASSKDAGTKSDLYEYYLLNGDAWQQNGDLDAARKSYSDAVSLDPARIEATKRLQRLAGYSTVELFDHFETFGEPGWSETSDGGATHQVIGGGLQIASTVPNSQTNRYFAHTPLTQEYAVVVEVDSVGPTAGVGLVVAYDLAETAYHFAIDPATQEWRIAYHNADGSWTDMILPTSYAGQIAGPIERLEVQVRHGTPKFFVNGVELSAPFDLSWMQIPQTGHSGVSVDSSEANPTAPISATFDSFGIYAL